MHCNSNKKVLIYDNAPLLPYVRHSSGKLGFALLIFPSGHEFWGFYFLRVPATGAL